MFYVYILKCSDDTYYTGMTEDFERRLAQHHEGTFEGSYTKSRRPIELAWSAEFSTHDDAFTRERQVKGWSRAKKEALFRGDWDGILDIIEQEHKKREVKNQNR
jgi:predicted GIY-YIG superfamily endonuclease